MGTANAGGLGILAGATMTFEELERAILEVRSRTEQPFGVSLRADASDAGDRVDLLIRHRVKVASVALAPKKELIETQPMPVCTTGWRTPTSSVNGVRSGWRSKEWDAVIRVHLKGHFAPLRHAAAWWRSEAKQGRPRAARVVNTSSGAGMQGSVGQTTYSAAKAGIAGMTLVAAAELARYGVRVNAIAPVARTRMTQAAFPEMMAEGDDPGRDGFDAMDPANNSPVVAWLASVDCDITGRVLEIEGGQICVEEGWRHGPRRDIGRRWDADEVGAAVRDLIGQAAPPEPVHRA